MKRICIFIILILVVGLLSGCGKSKLYLTGDKEAVGALVIIDGKEAGVMKGSESGANLTLTIPPGKHELVAISKNGKRLTARFEIKGENYLAIELFSK